MQLICGVHGVGKTVFAKKLCRKLLLEYYSAGELIEKMAKDEISDYKKVQHISHNQKLLLEALSEIKDTQYILDGHLCLLNTQNKIERISYSIFQAMNIESIYIVVDEPDKIRHTLKNRDKNIWTLGFIALFQQEEFAYANSLAKKMNIPLKIIYNDKEVVECSFLEKEKIFREIFYMNKLKLFVENFLIYGLGGIISKLIPLIMVPIVTKLMPTTDYYGISDLSNTVVQFGSSIAIMGMYDAMYRMFFEKDDEEYKKNICSTALVFTLATSLVVFLVMLVCKNMIAAHFFSDRKYAYVVYLSAMATLVGATNSIISAPTRMQNKRKIFLVTNTVGPLLSYSIAIPMLLAGHYIIALPLSSVISGITMEAAFGIMNHRWFMLKGFDTKLLKQLLVIAVPLLPNFLIYWIFNSCDKIMITHMKGIGDAGIYSVGSKLGNASQLIYAAFAGGWQYFAFLTMKEENQVKINSLIFEYLGIISFAATSFICAWSYGIFKVLFKPDYLSGYIVAPYLFLAPLLQMLFQVAANQFLIIKKTWPNLLILSAGAILNIIINHFLIPVLGIEGASIATLLGYVVSDIVCIMMLCYMKLMVITKRFIVAIGIMAAFIIAWRLNFSNNMIAGTFVSVMVTFLLGVLYRSDIAKLLGMLKSKQQ